jgi:hypothetical protein
VHLDPPLGHHPRGVGLDAQVDGGDDERLLAPRNPGGGDDVRLGRGDRLAEVGAGHLARLEHPAEERTLVLLGGGDADTHRATLAQVAGQGAGVDVADPDHTLLAQLVVQAALRAPVGRHTGGIADDVAGDPDLARLRVLVVHAGIADMRGRHHDDLAVVAGIGQCLLIAGHAGGEDRFAEGLPLGAKGVTGERPPVLEDEQRRRA